MISREKLSEYAKLKKYNLGQAEKDYFQELILYLLYAEFGKELVFKGGTALTKCYGFDRFSEDLDFTASKINDFEKVISAGLKKYYLDFTVENTSTDVSITLIYKINGPLYIGTLNSRCKIILDISLREKIMLKPVIKKIGLLMDEIPPFEVVVMSEEEIFAEKIRAVMTRNKARDLYDLNLLLEKNIFANIAIVQSKLDFYKLQFEFHNFKKAVLSKEVIWASELKYLILKVPKFSDISMSIIKLIQNEYFV